MKILCLMFVTTAIALQTSDTFREKYGSPVSETYMVSPGILATINYGKDGRPCFATVPAQANPKLTKDASTRIDDHLLRAIVDELVPKSQRGKLVDSGFVNLNCVNCDGFYGGYENYENVRIRIGGPANERETASIQWEGRSCER